MVNFQRGNDFRQITPYFLVTTGGKKKRKPVAFSKFRGSRIFVSSLHHPTCETNDEKRSSPFRATGQFLDFFFAYHSSRMDKKFERRDERGRTTIEFSKRSFRKSFSRFGFDRNEFENNDATMKLKCFSRVLGGGVAATPVFTNVTRVHGMGTTRIVNGSTNICGLLANNQTNRICTPCSN